MFANVLVALAVVALLAAQAPSLPIIEPDSRSYLENGAFRWLGYPLFLDVLQYFDASLRQIMWAQILVYSAAVTALTRVLWNDIAPWLAVVMALSLALNPFVVEYQFAIMSESIWFSTVLAWLAVLTRLYRPTPPASRAVLLFGLMTGLLVIIRPASLPFLPIAVVALFIIPAVLPLGARIRIAAVVLSVATVLIGAERVLHGFQHRGVEDSQTSVVLFARAILVPPAASHAPPNYQALESRVRRDLAPVLRTVDAAEDFRVRQYLLKQYGILGHFTYRPHELQIAAERAGLKPGEVMVAFAWQRIAGQPMAFLSHGFEQYLALWTILPINTPSGAAAYKRFLQRHAPLPFASELPALTVAELPYRWFFPYLQLALWGAGLALAGHLLWMAVSLVLRRSPAAQMRLALVLNLTIQLSFAGIALVNIAVERFTVAHMPLIALALLLIVRAGAAEGWSRVSRSR